MKRPEPNFKVGDKVECDSVTGEFQVTASWWAEASRWNYLPESGGYMHRVMFLTNKGTIDKRRSSRRFEESRLKLINP